MKIDSIKIKSDSAEFVGAFIINKVNEFKEACVSNGLKQNIDITYLGELLGITLHLEMLFKEKI